MRHLSLLVPKMRLVGLTGGIASGKSTVSKELQDQGLPIIDADKIAHAALAKNTWGWKRVVSIFGPEILRDDGEVNRPKLGEIVFSDSEKRQKLNSALSLPILSGMFLEVFKHWIAGTRVVILDVPLLFEHKLNRFTNPVIVVWVDEETQEARLIARNGFSREEAQNRIKAQLPLEWKCQHADIVLDNSGTLEETKEKVIEVKNKLVATQSWKELLLSRGGFAAIAVVGLLLWMS